jgi:hypothetical protein
MTVIAVSRSEDFICGAMDKFFEARKLSSILQDVSD